MQKYIAMVEKYRQKMLDAFDFFWSHAETGYKEWQTHAYLKEVFEDMGYKLTEAGNIPGFTTTLDTGHPGPTLIIFGEMDGLINFDHPDCNKTTGAVHSCGHCCQIAALIGIAAALKEPGALDGMCGKIMLVAVPAEELIEIEYRKQLRDQGIIKYFGGKAEFLARGLLDNADLAFMVHTTNCGSHTGNCNAGSNGLIAKTIEFQGVPAHAGGFPHKGINALYAANLGLNAINALRETFQDSSHIRVHPIITHGGDTVNTIPNVVRMESYVRGATVEQISDANNKVNRALAASAAALGANVRIIDMPGYMPRFNGADYAEIFFDAMDYVFGKVDRDLSEWSGGCSDMGDIASIMPALHPYVSGADGSLHSSDFRVTDTETALIDSAKVQIIAAKLLLENNAEKAKKIIADYNPVFKSKEEYIAFVDDLNKDILAVTYNEDGSAILNF